MFRFGSKPDSYTGGSDCIRSGGVTGGDFSISRLFHKQRLNIIVLCSQLSTVETQSQLTYRKGRVQESCLNREGQPGSNAEARALGGKAVSTASNAGFCTVQWFLLAHPAPCRRPGAMADEGWDESP